MVLAYHVIFTAYGFWLPNDPRGSWSTFVAAWELLLAGGKATKTDNRRSVARAEHDREKRLRTRNALKHPPVRFDGEQALSISRGFAQTIAEAGYPVHACFILPRHIHMVLGRRTRDAERMVGHFKSSATRELSVDGLHPFAGMKQSPWAERCWKVFLDSMADIERAVCYVKENPIKEGKRRQRWSFVTAYRG